MQEKRTTVFIGSSKEGLGIAQAIQLELEADAICTIWYQGVFGLSKGTLQSLYDALPNFEFAILVLTPDDLVVFRDQVVQLPRDNILFELGLFMGHLGPERVFVVYCDDGQTKLPSDLAGISLAKFRKLDETRKISSYLTNELLPLLGPAGSKIRMAIQKIKSQQSIDVTVHYIVPSLSHNDYYARFQGRLETELSKIKNISWYYHPPKGDSPQDIYLELAEILKIMRFNDAVILVPKKLNDPQLLNQFEELLDQNPSGKIILIDQQPPSNVLRFDRVSFVGTNNRKVGIFAAFKLHNKLKNMDEALYYGIEGPGGHARIQGFIDGVNFFDPDADVEVVKLKDADRIENLPYVRHIIRSCPPDRPAGVFSGNDETAFAVLRCIEEENRKQIFVVGCNATREMRFAVDTASSCALATIDTKLDQQAVKVLQVISGIAVDLQIPELYPVSIEFQKLLRDEKFKAFWESSS